MEAGRLDVHPERFLLSALVEDLQATFGPLTAEKGLDFEISIEPSAPAELVTDRQRLRQVLGNLLSNAVKFTENGQVALRVRAVSAAAAAAEPGSVLAAAGDGAGDGDGSLLAFSVTDTGIGIAPENLAVIFGAFQQGDGTLSRRYGGTGLGLSIASEVTALLGGRITAESDLGRGSTFTLYVPATLPDIPAADVAGEEFGAADGAREDGFDGPTMARMARTARTARTARPCTGSRAPFPTAWRGWPRWPSPATRPGSATLAAARRQATPTVLAAPQGPAGAPGLPERGSGARPTGTR